MALQARIADILHLGAGLQIPGQGQGVFAGSVRPHGEGPHTPQDQPSVKGADMRAQAVGHNAHPIHQLLGAADHAAQGIAVAADILGGGVENDVRPQCVGLQQAGGEESVIHNELGPTLVGQAGNGLHIHELQVGIGEDL